jgi:hypothetical protein
MVGAQYPDRLLLQSAEMMAKQLAEDRYFT